MPHREVIREESLTTKLRVVFDASSHAQGFPSLNDCLDKGVNLNPELLQVLLRFRWFPVTINSDIEKAFLQIEIQETDRDAFRFLWFDAIPVSQNSNILEWRMTRKWHIRRSRQLRSLIGMANYLARFVPHMAKVLQPVSLMMSSRQDFVWGPAQEAAFKKWKTLLSSDPVLGIYNSNIKTLVTADASSYGLGAVLRQRQKEGRDLTVADALSRSPLPQTESMELEGEIQGYVRLVASSVPVTAPSLRLIAHEQKQDPDKPTEERIQPRRVAQGKTTAHGPAHVQRKPSTSDARVSTTGSI
ncbi:uncharacterized protein LOC119462507 [Dermacentor silvarum]|uniref:uncharacterized protein LOC119462507 n=1 Tax=Dermacentor silvarum TaxID=543639 RepID=UPI0021017D42|nr:uncharacterized protein LOC119462507 [Dermacentor silvarum]